MNRKSNIWIYDTTLRDGSQGEGISSLSDKLKIARKLDRLGVPFIEGGWSGANPKDVQFFWKLVEVNGKNLLQVAEGNDPVAALDRALCKALVKFYPQIADFYLADYKVRILDGSARTAAKTSALVESSNGVERWTTVGVSTNILDAS